MQEIIRKADVLIEALPYIQRFRGAVIVVKLGGSAMEDAEHLESIVQDIAFMECVGMRPVIVHGGGKAISRGMQDEGIESRFLHGLRVTCEKTIAVVERVIKGSVNPRIVHLLETKGARAEALHGEKVFKVERVTGSDPQSGEKLDWGFVGEPVAVDTDPVTNLLMAQTIPVVTPLGADAEGRLHNINADTAAAALAKALKARKLAFVSDVPGLLRNPEDPDSLISHLALDDIDRLIDEGVISGGMLPKVRSCVEAIQQGVRKVHMIDGRMTHSLLLEIFTDKGVGTEIVAND